MEPECTVRCRSWLHARQLMAAITKGTTEQVKAYCRSQCHNFVCVCDDLGKNILHVAASCGKWEIVQWLLETCNAHVDIRDGESGWTALHRSLFYGQLASAGILLNHKASLHVTDHDGLNPLELVMLDRLPYIEYLPNNPSEVYVWGSNSNFNLGLDKQQSKENPELVELFRRENVSIKKVIMCKFHSVFLSHDGRVFTCGLGRGGRLGQNTEGACLIPLPVQGLGGLCCEDVASGQDHLILLTENGQVWTCGTNEFHQLGHTPPPNYLMTPRPINLKFLKGKTIVGVGAARYHSLFYTEDAIYTFGLNAGQLGHPRGDKFQTSPRQISSLNEKNLKITHIAVSDGATVCATNRGDVIVQHEYQCRKIASRQLEIKKLCALGGHLDARYLPGTKENEDLELRVVVLTHSGRVYIWRENNPVLTRCIFSVGRELSISDLDMNNCSLLLSTSNGEGFLGQIISPKEKRVPATSETGQGTSRLTSVKIPVATLTPFLEKDECNVIRIRRIPYIHRAVAVSCDIKGRNFAIVQSHPKTGLLELPSLPLSHMQEDFKILLEEISEYDQIHDVVVKVENHEYLAHKYILGIRSEHFQKQFQLEKTPPFGVSEVVLQYVTARAFEEILQFIYSNTCDLLTDGKVVKWRKTLSCKGDSLEKVQNFPKSKKNSSSKTKKSQNTDNTLGGGNDFVAEVQDASRRLGISLLTKRLSSVKIINERVKLSDTPPLPKLKFDRNKLANLHDVVLKAESGKTFPCHKCVLTARSDYFKSMLGSGWIETTSTEALCLPIPSDVLEIVLDFLYTDEAPKIFASEDAEFVCQVLVIADQLLINNLKQMCEVALVEMITLKNVSELLELSYIYNATQLKASCLQYCCINLSAIIETGSLEMLSSDALTDLTSTYRNLVPQMANRVITPYSCTPSEVELNDTLHQANISEEALPVSVPPVRVIEKAKNKRKSLPRKTSSNGSCEGRSRNTSSSEPGELVCAAPSILPDYHSLVGADQFQNYAEKIENPSQTQSLSTPRKVTSPNSSLIDIESKPKQPTLKWNKESWVISAKPVTSPSLMDIMMEEEHRDQKGKTSSNDIKKSTRTAPKQWKKLPLPLTTAPVASPVGHSSPPPTSNMTIASCPWGNMPQVQQLSFWKATKADTFTTIASNLSSDKPCQTAGPRLGDILKAEEAEQKNMAKFKAKPLHLISTEDQAINELLKTYNATDNPDERITVQRVLPENVAAPVWKKY